MLFVIGTVGVVLAVHRDAARGALADLDVLFVLVVAAVLAPPAEL